MRSYRIRHIGSSVRQWIVCPRGSDEVDRCAPRNDTAAIPSSTSAALASPPYRTPSVPAGGFDAYSLSQLFFRELLTRPECPGILQSRFGSQLTTDHTHRGKDRHRFPSRHRQHSLLWSPTRAGTGRRRTLRPDERTDGNAREYLPWSQEVVGLCGCGQCRSWCFGELRWRGSTPTK